MVATVNMLTQNQVVAYVGQHATQYGLDPAAVLAVANHEGLNTTPGTKWWLPKEFNWSFGPPSWYGNGAGSAILAMFGGNADQAAAWSWSPEGLDYWLQQVASARTPDGLSAVGKTGADAINAIVRGFERPAASNVAGEISNAIRDYGMFQQAVGTLQVPIPLPGQPVPIPIPGQAQPPAQAQPGASPAPSPGLLMLGQVGPFKLGVPSGLLLGLLALVLLIVGAVIMNGRENNVRIVTAMAAA